MSGERPIRILLVDDHTVVREGFESVLRRNKDFEVVASVGSGFEAITVASKQPVDVVLLDLCMPDLDGLQTLAALRAKQPGAAILVLTSDDRRESIRRAIDGGARGFLLKSIRSWDLVDAVQRASAGTRIPLSADVSARMGKPEEHVRFTHRELSVLTELAKGSSNEDIAEALGVSSNTVKTHLASVLGKLNATSRTEAVVTALRNGLIDVE